MGSYSRCSRVACIVRFFFQAEDGIRDLVRSRGLGDVYKRQAMLVPHGRANAQFGHGGFAAQKFQEARIFVGLEACLLYTSDAADERSSVDLGGRRIIKKKKHVEQGETM